MSTAAVTFLERDFLVYEKDRQGDSDLNGLRLAVRRKLKNLVDQAQKQAKSQGCEMASQAGLHHPYSFNNFKVSEQRAYLCRSNKERKKLATFFGDALGKDAETHYIQTIVELSLDAQVLEVALRIHPMAWWDGENLKKQVIGKEGKGAPEGMQEWCDMLRALPSGFAVKLHDWRKLYWATTANAAEMRELFTSYTPGEHWLHVVRDLPREDALAMGEDVVQWAINSMMSLLPMYRFILWVA